MTDPSSPTLLALDFDGVLCDGLAEYFQSAWRTYCRVWQSEQPPAPPETMFPSFCRLRPVIETGWEMPLLIRALVRHIPEATIFNNWSNLVQQLLTEEECEARTLGRALDQCRDEWIQTDLAGWLARHQFYPGIIAQLQQWSASRLQVAIVTTKEGRFVRQLLEQQGVELASLVILGKEIGQPKHQTLRQLMQAQGNQLQQPESVALWFVEDRLQTLQSVQEQSDLQGVKLFLADWGYNTQTEREAAHCDSRVQLLALAQFVGDWTAWC